MIFKPHAQIWGAPQIILGDFSIWFGDLEGAVKNSESLGDETHQVWGRPGFYVGRRMLVRTRDLT